MKELYVKCIPELAKFEMKLIEQADLLEKFNHILLKFDMDLVTRADKISLNNFKVEVNQKFINKDVLPELDRKHM